MLFGERVEWGGMEFTVTSTYDDGTVDLDHFLNVNKDEVEVIR